MFDYRVRGISIVARRAPALVTMEGLVRQKSVRERAVAEAALAALRAEEESEAALTRELNETLFEIENLQAISSGSGNTKRKKKKKKHRPKQLSSTAGGTAGASAAAQLMHTRSQIDALTRELSRAPAATSREAPEHSAHAVLVHTRSQIAQLTRELSGAAGGGRTVHAQTEDEIIDAQLAVLGKAVYQIRPDGDCLFSALADQLRRADADSTWARGGSDALRSAAASEMRANADEYAPFLTEDLETYAARIEGPTHEWGGHLELRALSDVLRCIIVVHSANEAPLRLEPTNLACNRATIPGGRPAPTRQLPELHISYHQHQYMLGEHYNSVIPAAEARGARNQGDDDGWTVA